MACGAQNLADVQPQGHSSTVEYRSPKPRMRVRFLLPLPLDLCVVRHCIVAGKLYNLGSFL